jgi:hypothetical protein
MDKASTGLTTRIAVSSFSFFKMKSSVVTNKCAPAATQQTRQADAGDACADGDAGQLGKRGDAPQRVDLLDGAVGATATV